MISSKNDTAACFSEVGKSPSVADQLSIHQLDLAIDAWMLQCFGKRNVSAQNDVVENFPVKKLRRVCQKDRWKRERNIQRRHSKSIPIRSHAQRKIGCEAHRAGIGYMDHAAHVPFAGIDGYLNISW